MQHEDLSIISLVLNASIVVQLILALLVSLSIGSWSIIIRKGFALGSVKRATEDFEKNFWSGGDLNTLLEAAQRNQKQYANSLERIFQSGMQEFLKARDIDPARRAMKATYQREMDVLSCAGSLSTIQCKLGHPFVEISGSQALSHSASFLGSILETPPLL